MKWYILIACILCFLSCKVTEIPQANPYPELTEEQLFNITAQPKDFPLVLRRTTLIVRDIKQSLGTVS